MRAFLIGADRGEEDTLVGVLHDRGTVGLEERPAAPDRIVFLAYFEDDITVALRGVLGSIRGISVEPTEVPEVDWVARFRENFRAFAVGGFWITPVWDETTAAPPDGRRRLIVDPGRAFGTGTHESTVLCLRALEGLAARGPLGTVLDVGTGSGILAIAARLLGARTVLAGDNDPEAIESAREHARVNGAGVHLLRADGGRPFVGGRFDTVVANISAHLLSERAAELSRLPSAGGRLILAGLLAEELPGVRSAYGAFPVASESVVGEWGALLLERA